MEDDAPDRFLLYECRVPAVFWGEEWAAAQAEKPEYKPEYITRMLEFKKATKSTKAHYKCKTRDGRSMSSPWRNWWSSRLRACLKVSKRIVLVFTPKKSIC